VVKVPLIERVRKSVIASKLKTFSKPHKSPAASRVIPSPGIVRVVEKTGCAVKKVVVQQRELNPPGNCSPTGSNQSSGGGNETLKPLVQRVR